MGNSSADNGRRWAELCEKYRRLRERGGQDYFRLGRLAIHLRAALAKACGCDESYLFHYSYEHGGEPKNDQFERATSGWTSVSTSEASWVFALGIQLEISPDTYPKTVAVFPIEVTVSDNEFKLESSLFAGVEQVRGNQPLYSEDLERVAERIFDGLNEALDDPTVVSSKMGFTTLSDAKSA